MVGKLVKDCTDCSSLEDVICTLDRVLAQYGKNAWQNQVFLTNKATPASHIQRLLHYRAILENLQWNQCFYQEFCLEQIVSGAGALVAGFQQIPRGINLYKGITTTTTTTTTSTTSSTTTTTTTT